MKKLAFVAIASLALAACSDAPSPVAPRPTPTQSPSASRGAPIDGRYIVVFRGGTDVDRESARIAVAMGGNVTHRFHAALRGMAIELPAQAAAALANVPSVAFAEQDQVMTASTTQSSPTWGLDRIDQRALPLSGSFTYNTTGAGVTAYIIDTGILFSHSEFGGRATSGVDEITAGGDASDCNGHGTHVSGTVGGSTYGVAKNVNLVAVRVLDCSGSGSTAAVVAGIDWVTAQRQANPTKPAVANMSLGGGASSALDQAVANSVAAGVTYAVAAGNGNIFGFAQDACTTSPAREPSAITVSATDNTDTKASWANYGTCVDIFAPGVNITSSWYSGVNATNTISGTSMATPHVVGAAALYLEANPTATPAQVASALTSNATLNVVKSPGTGSPNKLLYTAFIGGGSTGPAPVASFTSSCSGLTCNFDASASTALSTATYSWTFGDGQSGSGKTTSHSYGSANNYSVTLTVTDANGTGTSTQTVTTTSSTPAPVAQFTYTCSSSSRNCSFDASTSTNATSYAWNFGDGSTGTGVTTSHNFPPNRSYTVTLTATGSGGSGTATGGLSCTKRSCSGNGVGQ